MESPKQKSAWHGLVNAVGFKKSYNFILFFIFGGALFGFTLARFQYLNLDIFSKNSAPGEWFWFRQRFYKAGLILHLATILPCSLLIILQFVPIIRHKLIIFHRINGYIVILLFTVSNIGALMIARRSFGGAMHIQFPIGLLVVMCLISISLAWVNIRRKQIEQHRAWMLRSFFYMGSIITIRPVMQLLMHLLDRLHTTYYTVWRCDELQWTWESYNIPVDYTLEYPTCNGSSVAAVRAASGADADPITAGSSSRITFGLALWIAIFLHMAGIEVYLRLTPREHQRLRTVSYERQMAEGYKDPGSAGIVVQNIGDAEPWILSSPL